MNFYKLEYFYEVEFTDAQTSPKECIKVIKMISFFSFKKSYVLQKWAP